MKTYEAFRAAIRQRESSDRYDCVSQLGYLGAYQFGMARLCDLGVTQRKDPSSKSLAHGDFEFKAPLTRELFLGSGVLQDLCFDRHVSRLKKGVWRLLAHRGQSLDLSGAIAGCHLLGLGGLLDYLKGNDRADALGTRFSEYYQLFSGYEIL